MGFYQIKDSPMLIYNCPLQAVAAFNKVKLLAPTALL
jgi:hypothetical protein